MNKKMIIYLATFVVVVLCSLTAIYFSKDNNKNDINKMTATLISKNGKRLTVRDEENIIYTFNSLEDYDDALVGSNIIIQYTGLLDKNVEKQSGQIVDLKTSQVMKDENGIPTDWLDNGIFSKYYILANNKLKKMSLDEKIAQLLLFRFPNTNAKELLKKYQFGGYVFYEKDFKDKNEKEVINMIDVLQKTAKIPLLTAVDEEGGKVVRVSSNPKLVSEPFKSSRELYTSGGFNLIRKDTVDKSNILNKLGLNLNLAPVIDVSTNSSDYIYPRTIGEDTKITSEYAKTVVEASKGTKVSYTLKHFPGYGSNDDTHKDEAIDDRTLEDIQKYDLPPFQSGIDAGAEAVLVSHNVVTSIDSNNPASLSPSVHNLLRNNLKFTGVSITDDLGMNALKNINDPTVKALLAGNDLIITTDYEESFNEIKTAINDGDISEELINKTALKVLAWKYYKGLMFDMHK